jgi:hypothetical protein
MRFVLGGVYFRMSGARVEHALAVLEVSALCVRIPPPTTATLHAFCHSATASTGHRGLWPRLAEHAPLVCRRKDYHSQELSVLYFAVQCPRFVDVRRVLRADPLPAQVVDNDVWLNNLVRHRWPCVFCL